jgi:hypothetical protein
MRADVTESWNALRDAALPRGTLSHEVRGAQTFRSSTLGVTNHSLSLTPKPRSRVAHEKC